MRDYTPTTDEAFNATIYTWVDWKGTFASEEEAADAWTRMLAEVERAAAEKAWEEGKRAVRAESTYGQLRITVGPNPYRRNEGGPDAAL